MCPGAYERWQNIWSSAEYILFLIGKTKLDCIHLGLGGMSPKGEEVIWRHSWGLLPSRRHFINWVLSSLVILHIRPSVMKWLPSLDFVCATQTWLEDSAVCLTQEQQTRMWSAWAQGTKYTVPSILHLVHQMLISVSCLSSRETQDLNGKGLFEGQASLGICCAPLCRTIHLACRWMTHPKSATIINKLMHMSSVPWPEWINGHIYQSHLLYFPTRTQCPWFNTP